MGHEAVRLSEVGLAEATDLEVISHAVRQGAVVLAFDLDYAALTSMRSFILKT
jgi:predicted nuclease of predicted toxin-antitoxin system